MKRMGFFLSCMLIANLIGFGLAQSQTMPSLAPEQIKNQKMAEEHRYAADLIEETIVRLESKVDHLLKRVERYNKKPYLDPKEVKRETWKRLIRGHTAEISELRKEMSWNRGQAKRLSDMSSSE